MDGPSLTYATSKDWLDIMKNRSKVRMHELIERLGLRAKWSSNKRGKTNFESALVRELVADMGDVVSNLPKEPDELIKFLSEEGSLKEDVDNLMEKHGSKVWGRVGDRDHLITVGEPGVEKGIYPRDLYVENDEDKELIRVLLHWWVGLKACNVILARERLDRERKKKEENRKARAELEHQHPHALLEEVAGVPGSFVALAPSAGAGPPTLNTAIGGTPIPATEAARHIFHADSASRGSPISSAMLTPPESSESPIAPFRGDGSFTSINPNGLAQNGNASAFTTVNPHLASVGPPASAVEGVYSRPGTGDKNGSRHSSLAAQAAIKASSWPLPPPHDSKASLQQQSISQAAAIRQLNTDLSKLVASFGPDEAPPPPPPSDEPSQQNSSTYRGLDIETLQALRAYIYGEESTSNLDEDTLLNRLEKAWREGVRSDYDRIIDNIPVFIARERAFLTWLELKRHLAALERADQRWRSEGTTAPEIERRIQQHRTLMGATQSILVNFEDIGKGFGLDPNAQMDRDEVLRQAFVVLAGEKYAVEMLWKGIEYTGVIRWLGEHLEAFRKDEEEEGRGLLWYVG